MKRRHLALSGLALASVATGVLWRRSQEAGVPGADGPEGAKGLWAMRFDKPGGGELRMADFRGHPLVLNFWGSWCPPCVAEMPELDAFARSFGPSGWRVLGLAVDNPKAVLAFLANKPVSYAIGLAGFDGAALSRNLGNSQGGLPFTVVFNRQAAVTVRHAGAATLSDMRRWAAAP
jgi:thiol-disulfide isomerase/thioredoxin